MTAQQILQYLNHIVKNLHGIPVTIDGNIIQTRLEPYAQLLLFYQLNLIWPLLDEKFATNIIANKGMIKEIINKALINDGTQTI